MNTAAFLDETTQKNVDLWLSGPYDENTKKEIRRLLKEKPKELIDAFYTHLTFGTGGLRGIMGVGTNRMNRYTVGAATQGLANYLLKQPKGTLKHSVIIGYDSRHHSREFAEEAAQVLAGNGITVYLFNELRPTPLVSYGCREKKCSAAIMITASHNPPEYNGYKVYWKDGAQILPPHDKNIISEVAKVTNPSLVRKVPALNHPLIEIVKDKLDESYKEAIKTLQFYPEINQKKGPTLKVVYTSLHGTGITLVPSSFKEAGFTNLTLVENQVIPDGNFPTCPSPNPEEKGALKLGIEKLQEAGGDLLIANDPDADRIGIVTRHQNRIHILTGNQIACLCLHFILESLTEQNRLPEKAAFVKTIVTTELFEAICKSYDKTCVSVLTGFKYIAEKIHQWEQEQNGPQYIFGGEESYGYLVGTITRDKDAITAGILVCEAALKAKLKGKTLVDILHAIYAKYGLYYEKLSSITFEESKAGREQMEKGMDRLQKTPPSQINGINVEALEDYLQGIKVTFKTGEKSTLNLPRSEVLSFWLADGSKIVIRPSGTEPKIKIYCGANLKDFSSIEEGEKALEKHTTELIEALRKDLYQ